MSLTMAQREAAGRGFASPGPIYVEKADGTFVTVADENGNVDAPVTTTDLTATGNTTLGNAVTDTTAINGATTITSTSASALTVGANGATNPVLKVNASTASVATGISVTGAAAAGGVAVAVTSSGVNESLLIDAKGSGAISLGTTSNGNINLLRAAVLSSTLDIGTNVTLAKETAHTVTVTTSTTATAAGGALTFTAGAGATTGAGGAASLVAGAGGNNARGGHVFVTGGAAGGGNNNGGDVILTPGALAGSGFTGVIQAVGLVSTTQGTPAAKTVSATLTAAELKTGIITVNQAGGATSAQQLPTAADMDTAFPTLGTDSAFDFSVINTSTVDAEDASITTNTGWTLVGSMDIHAYSAAGSLNSSALFRARKTDTAAWTLYRIA